MWYQFFRSGLIRPIVRTLWHPWVVGEENLPSTGGAVLACNHIEYLDPVIVAAMIPRQLTYPAKKELFQGDGGLRSKAVAWFLKAVDQVPLDRSGGRRSVEGMRPILDRLREGGMVGIFPEGTRSADGEMFRGKTGVARLALMAGVPVIPAAVVGTGLVRGAFGIPKVVRPGIIIGKPLDFEELRGREEEAAVLRWVTNEVMDAIQQLGGQDYVDVYGFRVKYGNLKGKDLTPWRRPRPGGVPAPEPHQDRDAGGAR
ncbi:lysophospholipid acyltransferase family protein [Acidipropionibacterium jensenii]|uniref:1-acyl-sn-glycerol-3-phosphate acyltransferase n=1 Tax=Acidipropionibacterium jensenii TaxID=1749 RepID=A0A448NX54_9ACTN|nr:lysophospholipid acyltransferase family protein [Acidipropionibacterium jensenii]AZZ39811.1 1-acyl-sn-glycerol-3-phosphate acyltransferase [Acidipropionibacterium jensenii]MDN5977737.1 1-acyl-sn-glycerol-3-phosphate acyltransferase [Acidipropionibacterium jensenii]MDN5996211.1 1-acyl-sn-glycerol-3-phosphate acyltransferase [Acidipropionibacterium jensenii]MDN6427440.1 1-acyl-sn-glycerol-3-phosphate acyltransferase [Acidipropionibacterium jensenii]MDN6441585.1 1-acyl-sn-glycerol-3-phosphate 